MFKYWKLNKTKKKASDFHPKIEQIIKKHLISYFRKEHENKIYNQLSFLSTNEKLA